MSERLDFEKAIAAIRAGDNATGQRLLVSVLKANPKNELAWMWLVRALPDDRQRMAALEQCLKINPNSETARRALEQLQLRHTSQAPSANTPADLPPLPSRPAGPPSAVSPLLSARPLAERLSRRSQTAGASQGMPAARAKEKASLAQKRRKRPRLMRPLETGLIVLIVAAAGALIWVVAAQMLGGRVDPVAQSQRSTAAALETENAALRQRLDARRTQSASAQGNPLADMPTPTVVISPTLTVTTTIIPLDSVPFSLGWIAPENIAALIEQANLPGEFFLDLAYSPDGSFLAATASDSVSIWDAKDLALLQRYDLERGAGALAFSPDSQTLFFAQVEEGIECVIYRVDVGDWSEPQPGLRSVNPVTRLLFTRNTQMLAAVLLANEANLNLIDIASDTVAATLEHKGGVLSAALDLQTGFLATGGYDETVVVLDVLSRQEVTRLTGHNGDITALTFSPNGRFLASGAQNGEVRLWDALTWQLIERYDAHEAAVKGLAFSLDNRILVSGGEDGQLIAWDLLTREPLRAFPAPAGLVGLSFSPDGSQLAVAGEKALILWGFPEP
jgi:hypothetical protein